MGRASKIGAHFGPYRAGPQTARVATSLRAPISRPMAAPAQSRSADLSRRSRLLTRVHAIASVNVREYSEVVAQWGVCATGWKRDKEGLCD